MVLQPGMDCWKIPSFTMPLFGRKPAEIPSSNESISKLRETIFRLEKREDFLQQRIDKEMVNAKKYMAANNKRTALLCLKRKKTLEGQAEKILAAVLTLEEQVMALEGASASLDAMSAMQMGALSMKAIHKDMV